MEQDFNLDNLLNENASNSTTPKPENTEETTSLEKPKNVFSKANKLMQRVERLIETESKTDSEKLDKPKKQTPADSGWKEIEKDIENFDTSLSDEALKLAGVEEKIETPAPKKPDITEVKQEVLPKPEKEIVAQKPLLEVVATEEIKPVDKPIEQPKEEKSKFIFPKASDLDLSNTFQDLETNIVPESTEPKPLQQTQEKADLNIEEAKVESAPAFSAPQTPKDIQKPVEPEMEPMFSEPVKVKEEKPQKEEKEEKPHKAKKSTDDINTDDFAVMDKKQSKKLEKQHKKAPNTRKRIVPFIIAWVFLAIAVLCGYFIISSIIGVQVSDANGLGALFLALFGAPILLLLSIPTAIAVITSFVLFSACLRSKYVAIKIISLVMALSVVLATLWFVLFIAAQLTSLAGA